MRFVFLSVCLLVPLAVFAVDLSTQNLIHETAGFAYYAEDGKNYGELIDTVEAKNELFERIFATKLERKVNIYIFTDQLSFSKHVFGSDQPVQNATGLADHVSYRFYVTSHYDTCKPRSRLLQTPVHELVHLYFPSGHIWIREGIACYYADMLFEMAPEDIPDGISDMRFYADGEEETRKAYNSSGWLTKYIIEQLCENDPARFRFFEENPDDYTRINVRNESELFAGFRDWLSRRQHHGN